MKWHENVGLWKPRTARFHQMWSRVQISILNSTRSNLNFRSYSPNPLHLQSSHLNGWELLLLVVATLTVHHSVVPTSPHVAPQTLLALPSADTQNWTASHHFYNVWPLSSFIPLRDYCSHPLPGLPASPLPSLFLTQKPKVCIFSIPGHSLSMALDGFPIALRGKPSSTSGVQGPAWFDLPLCFWSIPFSSSSCSFCSCHVALFLLLLERRPPPPQGCFSCLEGPSRGIHMLAGLLLHLLPAFPPTTLLFTFLHSWTSFILLIFFHSTVKF